MHQVHNAGQPLHAGLVSNYWTNIRDAMLNRPRSGPNSHQDLQLAEVPQVHVHRGYEHVRHVRAGVGGDHT